MYPILIDFGEITLFGHTIHPMLPAYGALYALAIVVGWLLFRKLGREHYPDAPWTDIYFLSVIGGVIGGKLLNALTVLPSVLAGHIPPIAIVQGGGVWLGGALTGSALFLWFAKRHGIHPGVGVNVVFTTMPLAHAVGRLGCFLGGCCYGAHCDLPWAVTFSHPVAHAMNRTPLGEPLHPTQLYEVGVELINFAIAYALWRRGARPYAIAVVWLGLYGAQRFVLEVFRADYRGGFLLSTSQWISLGMVAGALLVFFTLLGGRLFAEKGAEKKDRAPRKKRGRRQPSTSTIR